ncbi:peptidase [Arthrobacter sp. Hiyo4]|nr:peptidase [Arthrobacter sp. Hiyo4]
MTPTPAASPSDANTPGSGHPAPAIDADGLRLSVAGSFDTTLDRLKELVAIPGIAWPSFDPAPLEASAQAVAELLRAAGLEDVQVLRSITDDGTPADLPSSHADGRQKGSRPSCCTPTTTSSLPGTRRFGKQSLSPPSNGTAGCTAVVLLTTRPG